MIGQKPSIIIFTYQPDSMILKEILAGIEEEQVLCEIMEQDHSEPVKSLALKAAETSKLGIGIGLSNKFLMVQTQKTKSFDPIFPLDLSPRTVGQNLARYIKVKPFILKE